jgi:integrase
VGCTEIRLSDILKSTRKKNMARIDAKELPALLRAIEVYEGRQLTRLAIKLMALTFVRIGELIGARQDEFRSRNDALVYPRRSNQHEDVAARTPSRQAIEVLELLRQSLEIRG